MNIFSSKQNWWDDALIAVASVESYRQVVQVLFEDGNVNWGRLLVLEMFTKDVCEHHPDLAREVWTYYKNICKPFSHHLSSGHQ